jgi:hypothetical protein
MSRSTPSPPLERGVPSQRAARARPAKSEDERQTMHRRTAPQSRSRTLVAAAGRNKAAKPHSNPQEVHCDADAVRSGPRF